MVDQVHTTNTGHGRAVNVGLWLVQVLLLLVFGAAAWLKIMTPIPGLAAMWPWAGELPPLAVRSLGVIDLAGGAGVVLPMATGIRPRLTVAAALGCVALQICALVFHLSRGEVAAAPVNVVLLVMAAFVAWGRWNLGHYRA